MSVFHVALPLLSTYAIVGLSFALAFVCVGVKRIDPIASHAPLRVRLIFLPGVTALWPLLARKWINASRKTHP